MSFAPVATRFVTASTTRFVVPVTGLKIAFEMLSFDALLYATGVQTIVDPDEPEDPAEYDTSLQVPKLDPSSALPTKVKRLPVSILEKIADALAILFPSVAVVNVLSCPAPEPAGIPDRLT